MSHLCHKIKNGILIWLLIRINTVSKLIYLCVICWQTSSLRYDRQGKYWTNTLIARTVKSDFSLSSSTWVKRYSLFWNSSMFETSGRLSSKWFEGILSNVAYWAIQCISEFLWFGKTTFDKTLKSKLSKTSRRFPSHSTRFWRSFTLLLPTSSMRLKRLSLVCVMPSLLNLWNVCRKYKA